MDKPCVSSVAPDTAVIFQHIPKTAGSTLHTIFNKRYDRSAIFNIFASSYDDKEALDLRNLPGAQAEKIRVLKGHMPFGLHEYLPVPAKYFTVLRDPVKRVISQYFYILRNPRNPLYEPIVKNKMNAAEFVSSGISVGMNNGQIRWILGEINALPFGVINQGHLEQAKETLARHFFLTGINERFDETILLLSQKLCWNSFPYYRRQNTNRNKTAIGEEQIRIIEQYNSLDIELYQFANSLLDAEIAKLPGFSEKLKSFQQRNRLYQWIFKPLTLINR